MPTFRFGESCRLMAKDIKERRLSLRLTQEDLAKQMKSSPSRIAKMEASDPAVSMDFLVRSLLVLGATTRGGGVLVLPAVPHLAKTEISNVGESCHPPVRFGVLR